VLAAILIPWLTGIVFAGETGGDKAAGLYQRTDYDGAIALLKQRSPDAQNLELLGQCYFQLGDFRKATDALQKAAALAPSDSAIQKWLGRAWGERAETAFPFAAPEYAKKSREAFEKAVRLDPANTDAISDLLDFYIQAPGFMGGGIEKARGLIPSLQQYDPIAANIARSRIDESKKQFAEAEAQLRDAVRMAPNKLEPVLDLAQFLGRRGRYDESDREFLTAEKLSPASPRIVFARADTDIRARRNLSQARDLMKQYLSGEGLTPEDPPRWEALKLLKKAQGN
jgi:cytochrome c-type biogenesis protein CcmH/NrfG